MKCKNIYSNHFLRIRIFTNSKTILRLVDNFLDFNTTCYSKPKIKIDFYLDEVNSKDRNDDRNFLYQSWFVENENLLSSFGNRIVTVTANPKTGTVKGSILSYQKFYKERILDFIFTQPLHFILAHYGLFFLHASVVCKDKDCILISGPQDSGKSTLALTLAQNGFSLLSDDDCFVKLIKRQIQLFPFPTKMGLNARILKKYPELYRYTLKNYRYGGKPRISLSYVSNSNNIKTLKCKMIIFPNYKAYRNMSMRQLSKKDGLGRLTKENLIIYDKDGFQKLSVKNFEALCNLIERADSFELTYNDDNLNKIPGVIKNIGNF